MGKLEPELINKLWLLKVDHDSYKETVQAIDRGEIEVPEDKAKKIRIASRKYEEDYESTLEEVVKNMPLVSNVLRLDGNWYLIRYQLKDGSLTGTIKPVLRGKISSIRIDGRIQPQLGEELLNTMLDEVTNFEELLEYQEATKDSVSIVAEEELKAEPKEQKGLKATTHAVERYRERILGGNDSLSHYAVRSLVEDGANGADVVWEEDEEEEGKILYRFNDESNIMYVTGENQSIITLYEMDYGFSKEINNSIVHQQLQVLKESCDHLEELGEANKEKKAKHQEQIDNLEEQVSLLRARIEILNNEKSAHRKACDILNMKEELARSEYHKEHRKLFKPWKQGEY